MTPLPKSLEELTHKGGFKLYPPLGDTSSCHRSPLRTSTGDEGTSYYVCSACGEACDVYVPDESEYNMNDVDLCKDCGTAKHLNPDGLCGRCNMVEPDSLAWLEELIAWCVARGVDVDMASWSKEKVNKQFATTITEAKADIARSIDLAVAKAIKNIPFTDRELRCMDCNAVGIVKEYLAALTTQPQEEK